MSTSHPLAAAPSDAPELSVAKQAFLGGGTWTIKKLNKINVFLGRNGSGKSMLLRAIRDQRIDNSHYIVPERTGEISFAANLIEDTTSAQGRRNRTTGNYLSDYRSEIVTRIQAYYTKRGTKPKAEIHHDPSDLIREMNILLPDFTIDVHSESPFYELKRIRDGERVSSVSNLSSGESQLVSLGLDVLTMVGMWQLDNKKDQIILIDEPDAHIHHDLQIKFADFIVTVQKKYNVKIVIATHSTTLLSALGMFGKADVSVFYIDPKKPELIGDPFDDVKKQLSSILGGHLILGPLFAARLLLVEGDDDYRVWVHAVRGGNLNACVLPCNGEEIFKYQKTLEKMFCSLSENQELRGIALCDGDKKLPTPNSDNPQKFTSFVRLNCRETENLYLCDEVLQEIGIKDWNEAISKIKTGAEKYLSKAPMLKKIRTMDRQKDDFKEIIVQIAEILDPKKVAWTARLGKLLGKGKPTGLLASFIGKDLINLLWQ